MSRLIRIVAPVVVRPETASNNASVVDRSGRPATSNGIAAAALEGRAAIGALLLFLTNLSAVLAASSAVFLLFGFRPDPGGRFRVFGRSMVGVIVLLIVVWAMVFKPGL